MRSFIVCSCLIVLAFAPAHAQNRLPDVNPLTGKPFSEASRKAFDDEMRQIEEEEQAATQASARHEEEMRPIREANRPKLDAHEQQTQQIAKANRPVSGTDQTFISTSVSDEGLPEGSTIKYIGKHDLVHEQVSVDANGNVTAKGVPPEGRVATTVDGIQADPHAEFHFTSNTDVNGDSYYSHVEVRDPDGTLRATYDFNEEGIAWQGETFDAKGKRTGAFQDESRKPRPREYGAKLPVPDAARSVTGICAACAAEAEARNDVAAQMNRLRAKIDATAEVHVNQHVGGAVEKTTVAEHEAMMAEWRALEERFKAADAALMAALPRCAPTTQTAAKEPAEDRSIDDTSATDANDGLSFWLGGSAGYKFATFDGRHDLDGGETTTGSLDAHGAVIGLDGRVYFPRGSLPLPLFLTMLFAYTPSLHASGLFADLHPTAGNDTRLKAKEKWLLRALVGGEMWRHQALTLSLLAGFQVAKLEARMMTDESGGGGIRNVFTRNRLLFGPIVGAEINRRLSARWIAFLAMNASFLSELTGSGVSANNAFPYAFRLDDGIQFDVRSGLLFRF